MRIPIVAVLLVSGSLAWAQTTPQPGPLMDAAGRNRVIDRALALLEEHYVFPDVAAKMAVAVRESQKRGAYDALSDPLAFRARLESDLRGVSRDKHLDVIYNATPMPEPSAADGDPAQQRERFAAMLKRRNHCFERVERLPGNIGYIDLRCFGPAEIIAETAAAAFTFVGHSDALIVDLRENTGGDPTGVALVTSYVFATPTRLNDLYFRRANRTEQFWTQASVPGRRLPGADVYVLTSSRTFSAGEEFAYNLKNLKRARIIGEVTGGGAHPVSPHRIDDHFTIGVPFARAINPITGTNWEGVGVTPDEVVPASGALAVAQLQALQKLKAKDASGANQRELDEAIARARMDLERAR